MFRFYSVNEIIHDRRLLLFEHLVITLILALEVCPILLYSLCVEIHSKFYIFFIYSSIRTPLYSNIRGLWFKYILFPTRSHVSFILTFLNAHFSLISKSATTFELPTQCVGRIYLKMPVSPE